MLHSDLLSNSPFADFLGILVDTVKQSPPGVSADKIRRSLHYFIYA
ncbi:hypothetical protein [Chlorogloea sp. CCALA 695]|nr:hypothetical protein [Chlorogloea sp. CCALA 695]